MKKIGLTTTVPIEVILAKGYTPVDINNLFILDKNYLKYIDLAEKDGFPKSTCAWIKGIYGVCISQGIDEIVGVVEGDCSNTNALMEVLAFKGIKINTFSYPHSHSLQALEIEIRRFADLFEINMQAVEVIRNRLNSVRQMAKRIDELTYIDGKATGFENHIYQVNMSDLERDVKSMEQRLKQAVDEISQRKEHKPKLRLGYIGVPPMTGDIYSFVQGYNAEFVYNEVQREFAFPRADQAANIFLANGEIAQKLIFGTMRFYRDYCSYNGKFAVDLDKLGIGGVDIAISTGYGRNNTDLSLFKLNGVRFQPQLHKLIWHPLTRGV